MSELVVVLPLVPVTPMVTRRAEPQEQVDLADDRHPALRLDGGQRGAEPRLGRREAAADGGEVQDERLARERRGGVDAGPEQEPDVAAPSRAATDSPSSAAERAS